jgi:hypothetical protein
MRIIDLHKGNRNPSRPQIVKQFSRLLDRNVLIVRTVHNQEPRVSLCKVECGRRLKHWLTIVDRLSTAIGNACVSFKASLRLRKVWSRVQSACLEVSHQIVYLIGMQYAAEGWHVAAAVQDPNDHILLGKSVRHVGQVGSA